ncbi:Mediator of RNA polymerase II transcription subunit 22 [Apophysomyces sp. BC1034]|nr:Mediator of RNA polymerase II transcription subunit 22 [Apophysomyces sp. BC1015]KAG0176310.1 Mediator of RNA polymerase II transcription subunit 22 [Apophysomyces sp. BC1021]KAG0186556.1 Mediator of RNA polymerase II transcription subunit 22 [Apophysomyces sp. BC1034]
MASLPPFMNTAQSSARPMLLQIEDKYNKRIDDDIAKLVDCFADIVKVGENKDKDKFKVAQEGYQIESQTAQIVRSSESLLGLITELKQHLLLNDTQTLSQLMQERSDTLTKHKNDIKEKIEGIKHDLETAIYDMESVYYRSLSTP